jgi:hypothetical protein
MTENHTTGIEPAMEECAVCMKLIPQAEPIAPDAHEYVLYFCGGQCHAAWEREQAEKLEREFAQRSGVKRD